MFRKMSISFPTGEVPAVPPTSPVRQLAEPHLDTPSRQSSSPVPSSSAAAVAAGRARQQQLQQMSAKWKETSIDNAAAFSRRPGTVRYAQVYGSPIPADAPFKLGEPMIRAYQAELSGATTVTLVSPAELPKYCLGVSDGLIVDANGKNFDTRSAKATNASRDAGRAIFVMDHYGKIYATNNHKEGKFHHSSFLRGASVACAGEIEVHDGVVKSISNKSGHYRPDRSHLGQAVAQLQLQGVNIGPDMIKLY